MMLRLLVAGVLAAGAAAWEQGPGVDAAAARLGFGSDAVSKIKHGEVVARDETPSSKRELAAAAAVMIRAPLAEVAALFKSGEAFTADPDDAAAVSFADRDVIPDDLAKMLLDKADMPEVRALLHAKAGEALNLSAEEATRFAGLRQTVTGPEESQDRKAAEIATAELRRVLAARVNAYRASGLDGIAPYARGGGDQRRAGDELTGARKAERLLLPEFQSLQDASLSPRKPAAGIESRFLAEKSDVEQRAEFVLTNLLFAQGDGEAAFIQRQFYVLHSYNAAEITGLCVAMGDSTVVFYSSRTSTDSLSGFGEQTRRNIGQKELREDLTDFLNGLKGRVEKGKKTEGKK